MGKNFINGEWKLGSGKVFQSTNPADEAVVWEGHSSLKKDIDSAVESAQGAALNWSNLPLKSRYEALDNFSNLLEKRKIEFADIISKEMGKPRWEALTEVESAIKKANISLKAYEDRCKEFVAGNATTRFKPHGVVSVFGSFNFPLHLPNGHIMPALLAGNTVVIKPSELTPLVGEKMVLFWQESGLPKGVLNLVQGGKETGEYLGRHPDVKGLFFTGSAQTGQYLQKKMSEREELSTKILALEMGGDNPLVVYKVKDLEAAVVTIILSAYLTSGQRCTCARRLIIPKGKAGDLLLSLLREKIKKIKVGLPREDPEPFMGTLISKEAADNVLETQARWLKRGAIPLVPCQATTKSMSLITPGLIDVTPISEREDIEVFGPLLQVIRVNDFDDAIQEANNTKYGLSAGLLSDDAKAYDQFYKEIKAGLINWNQPLTGASSSAPFGGIGCSGNYRPTAYFAADYCAYPVASIEHAELKKQDKLPPGLETL